MDTRAGGRVRDPNARTQYQLRLPKKLRKRKWKIGAIKNFINAHLFGYGQVKKFLLIIIIVIIIIVVLFRCLFVEALIF